MQERFVLDAATVFMELVTIELSDENSNMKLKKRDRTCQHPSPHKSSVIGESGADGLFGTKMDKTKLRTDIIWIGFVLHTVTVFD